MTMTNKEGGECLHCKVTVTEGTATARYRWKELGIDGTSSHDEDVSDWSDDDIQNLFADLLGIIQGEDEIEVVWD